MCFYLFKVVATFKIAHSILSIQYTITHSIVYGHSAIKNGFAQNQILYTLLGRIKGIFVCLYICFLNQKIISSAKSRLPVNFTF